ncbi:MAG TPA: Gfo/Idh/MocA family oxidoreductase [Pirellulales bacterium]|nr:Gfo/Idh/MocA family oxidoreductase [Pirellulales bacterium]
MLLWFVRRSLVCLVVPAMQLFLGATALAADPATPAAGLRAGIIGLDTSHAVEFAKLLNNPNAPPDLAGVRIVAAFPGGSDIPASRDRRAKFTAEIKTMNIDVVDSIPALLDKVDVVLLESVDGRQHLEQVRPVMKAGKPVFIDKPLAGSLVDAVAIAELGERSKTPWFSSSALRFGPRTQAARSDPKIGEITGCSTWGPCPLEPTHPDLYWYGIHGVETLYTIMGRGCETVARTHTTGTDFAIGVWKGGRIGTFRGIREGKADYGASVFGKTGIGTAGKFESYQPLVVEIVKFFKTRVAPVDPQETIEMMTFMEAADESERQGGRPVKLADVLAKARQQAQGRE